MQIRILKTELIDWRSIEPLQPANFKHIYNYKHIELSILENGFVNPFFVWESEGVIYSIDGVTRKEILSNLENVPDLLPAVFIDAKNRQDAVKILLSVFNTKENPIDLEVLTEWVNIEQVEVEVTSLNVVDIQDIEENEEIKDNPYTTKVEAPIYNPSESKPLYEQLYDDIKFKELIESIESSSVNKEDKEFLKLTATRHIVFNYQKIADIYAHSNKEVQQLMEDSALVIIDFDKAIELGYVKLSEQIAEQYKEEFGDDE